MGSFTIDTEMIENCIIPKTNNARDLLIESFYEIKHPAYNGQNYLTGLNMCRTNVPKLRVQNYNNKYTELIESMREVVSIYKQAEEKNKMLIKGIGFGIGVNGNALVKPFKIPPSALGILSHDEKMQIVNSILKAIDENPYLQDEEKEFFKKLDFFYYDNANFMNVELILYLLENLKIKYIPEKNELGSVITEGRYFYGSDNYIEIYQCENFSQADKHTLIHEFFHLFQDRYKK